MPAASFILHVDADAFYASVEQVLQPSLKGKALIVGGGDRGVVSSASYEARRCGVHSAMPIVQARKLCPHAVFLDPNFHAYKEFSMRMFGIMGNYSPVVEATSIDEGYVDLTGTLKLHKSPAWGDSPPDALRNTVYSCDQRVRRIWQEPRAGPRWPPD